MANLLWLSLPLSGGKSRRSCGELGSHPVANLAQGGRVSVVSTTGTSPKVSRVFSVCFYQQDKAENRLSRTSTPRTAYVPSLFLISWLPISENRPWQGSRKTGLSLNWIVGSGGEHALVWHKMCTLWYIGWPWPYSSRLTSLQGHTGNLQSDYYLVW